MKIIDHLIIGAGLSGLYLGCEFKKRQQDFLILEKSKGVGGRIATRRINEIGIDHGAPYLKESPLLMDVLNEHQILGGKTDASGFYVEGGMTAIPKKLAENLPIKKDEKVINLNKVHNNWKAKCESGNEYLAKNIIISSPIPQTLELLDKAQIDYSQSMALKEVTYSMGLLGIFITNEEILIKKNLPDNVHSVLRMKDRNLHPHAFVLRASDAYSTNNFEKSDETNLLQLQSLFTKSCESVPKIVQAELKKWRYLTPNSVISCPYLQVQEGIYIIGDGFLYPDVRGALLSAKGLSEKLI